MLPYADTEINNRHFVVSYGCVIYTTAVHVVSDLTMRQVHLDAILTRVLELCCGGGWVGFGSLLLCLLYTSPSPRDATLSRMPSSA